MGKHRVFVYGTLMQGARNHALLEEADLVQENVHTKEHSYLMLQFNSSSSPGKFSPAVKKGGAFAVAGEVYEVNDVQLAALDELEQNGVRYEREEVELSDSQKAWMYILIEDDQPASDQSRIKTEDNIQSWIRKEPSL